MFSVHTIAKVVYAVKSWHRLYSVLYPFELHR